MKIFFFVCVVLIATGFVIGTILLTVVLPFVLDPVAAEDEDRSTCSSDENDTDERTVTGDSDESHLSGNDERDADEIGSF